MPPHTCRAAGRGLRGVLCCSLPQFSAQCRPPDRRIAKPNRHSQRRRCLMWQGRLVMEDLLSPGTLLLQLPHGHEEPWPGTAARRPATRSSRDQRLQNDYNNDRQRHGALGPGRPRATPWPAGHPSSNHVRHQCPALQLVAYSGRPDGL
jgi:hypothetical protein